MDQKSQELLIYGVISLALALLFSLIAKNKGFFSLKKPLPLVPVQWYHVLLGFTCVILTQLITLGVISSLFEKTLNNTIRGLFISNSITLLLLILLTRIDHLKTLWKKRSYGFKAGFAGWIIALPWVICLTSFGAFILWHFFQYDILEQSPVQFLRQLSKTPTLFFLGAVLTVLIIPIIEEILFRGFLQNYLMRFFPPSLTFLLTALIFTLFHFSPDHGISNLVILTPLFLLACFLSFVYAKTGSLFSSIILHALFNGTNLFFLAMEVYSKRG